MTPSSAVRSPAMTDLARSAPAQRKSLWIPTLMVGLMLMVVVVNAVLIFFAQSTFSGLDTDKAYKEGVAYNATLKAAAANDALGWTAKTSFTPATDGRHLAVVITNKADAPIVDLAVTAQLVRPVSTAFDQRVILTHRGDGIYGADIALPALGSWELRLSATAGDKSWQTTQRVFVK